MGGWCSYFGSKMEIFFSVHELELIVELIIVIHGTTLSLDSVRWWRCHTNAELFLVALFFLSKWI